MKSDDAYGFQYIKLVDAAVQSCAVSSTGSQFVFLKCAAKIWVQAVASKQYCMHLFWAVWKHFVNALLKNGYHKVQLLSKLDWISTLQRSLVHAVLKNVHCLYENFKFNSNFSAIFWNHQRFFIQVTTKETVKVFTQLCCLIKLPLQKIFSLIDVLLLAKKIYYVLSSPEWTDNALSVNHSQKGVNSLFLLYPDTDSKHKYHAYRLEAASIGGCCM